ncbi:MAG TPA: hypothetical protein VEW70_20130, partial [Burkholderiales bacterium]|nr:hypothetical protein [Burkholderiales bacterium]
MGAAIEKLPDRNDDARGRGGHRAIQETKLQGNDSTWSHHATTSSINDIADIEVKLEAALTDNDHSTACFIWADLADDQSKVRADLQRLARQCYIKYGASAGSRLIRRDKQSPALLDATPDALIDVTQDNVATIFAQR